MLLVAPLGYNLSLVKIDPYYSSAQKRLFDLVISGLGLILSSPLILVISLMIMITSGRPIFYLQKRSGRRNRHFALYKFRTMYPGAHKRQWFYRGQNQAPEPMFKIFNDPRFVGVGRWLSKTGLDELPQLFNVLKGEMSLVGPRPLPVKEAQQLPSDWQFRSEVRPGIFSYWTLSASRHKSLAAWKKLDLQTLSKGNISADLRLILTTILRVVLKNPTSFFHPG